MIYVIYIYFLIYVCRLYMYIVGPGNSCSQDMVRGFIIDNQIRVQIIQAQLGQKMPSDSLWAFATSSNLYSKAFKSVSIF